MSRRIRTPAYCVRPRYSCGSPAQVSPALAVSVAADERDGHAQALTGILGTEAHVRAEKLGLHRIVYIYDASGSKDIGVVDLLTREFYVRPRSLHEGEKVDVWNDSEGWVSHVLVERYKGADYGGLKVRRAEATTTPNGDIVHPWESLPREVGRDFIRLASSVVVLDEQDIMENYL